jgi:hypothetical protein
MDTGKVSEMSAQIGQKAPDFKMQGTFKGLSFLKMLSADVYDKEKG